MAYAETLRQTIQQNASQALGSRMTQGHAVMRK